MGRPDGKARGRWFTNDRHEAEERALAVRGHVLFVDVPPRTARGSVWGESHVAGFTHYVLPARAAAEARRLPFDQEAPPVAAGCVRLWRGCSAEEGRTREEAEKCACREPRRHRDCAYCGTGYRDGASVCGLCREAGIDGPVVRGTERRTCRKHRGGR